MQLDGDNVRFTNRNMRKPLLSPEHTLFPLLDAQTYNEVNIVAPGHDAYALAQQWRELWVGSGKPQFNSPDAALIGFCKHRHQHKPHP